MARRSAERGVEGRRASTVVAVVRHGVRMTYMLSQSWIQTRYNGHGTDGTDEAKVGPEEGHEVE